MEEIDYFRILKACIIFFTNNVQSRNWEGMKEMLAESNSDAVKSEFRALYNFQNGLFPFSSS